MRQRPNIARWAFFSAAELRCLYAALIGAQLGSDAQRVLLAEMGLELGLPMTTEPR